MTLEHLAWLSDLKVETHPTGGKYVISKAVANIYHPLLWHLDDYLVSSVTSGDCVNLVPCPNRFVEART